ncbi:2TM domain-containing protein [Amycolatopsis thermoflava]|uniref:2TM domain-containing protein n=1 Tax=Amycolatopsis thermoflava TaxID=84480 RepID=UPI003646FE9A
MTDTEPGRRQLALARLKRKHDYYAHVLAFVLFNGFLVGIWALTGAGFFWPMFPLALWGFGLIMHTWDTFAPNSPSEKRIRREMDRMP